MILQDVNLSYALRSTVIWISSSHAIRAVGNHSTFQAIQNCLLVIFLPCP